MVGSSESAQQNTDTSVSQDNLLEQNISNALHLQHLNTWGSRVIHIRFHFWRSNQIVYKLHVQNVVTIRRSSMIYMCRVDVLNCVQHPFHSKQSNEVDVFPRSLIFKGLRVTVCCGDVYVRYL